MSRSTHPRRAVSRARALRFGSAAVAAGVAVCIAAAATSGPATAADKQLSTSSGRFLSGTVGTTSFDTIAGILGEKASYPADPGANKNSLNAELLNNAISLPFGSSGLQLPDPTGGAIQLGAVAQYAKANADGSSIGASGAVDSNGGVGVAGSNGVPTGGATIDLSGSKVLSALTSQVANLKLTIGAVAARAQQVAIGKKIADPSAGCTTGNYSRVSDGDQAGRYNIAGLSIDLTSPLLSQVLGTVTSTLEGILNSANATSILETLNSALKGLVQVTVPDPANVIKGLLHLSLANGAITLDLESGAVHIDLAALLKFLGLDLNNLCPNTSLLPYVVKALTTELPKALQALVESVTGAIATSLKGITITLLGTIQLGADDLTNLVNSLTSSVTSALGTVLGSLDTSALDPLLKTLSDSVLNLVANGQDESGGVLTQTALQLNLLPNGTPTAAFVPAAATVPDVPSAATLKSEGASQKAAFAQYKQSHPNAKVTTYTAPAGKASAVARPNVTLDAVSPDAATNPLVQLNLAKASVGPNAAPVVVTTTPVPTTSVPTSKVPTGVPAGQGAGGGSTPATPLILVLIALGLAAGGVTTYRLRGSRGSH